jgi:hypothetical protein
MDGNPPEDVGVVQHRKIVGDVFVYAKMIGSQDVEFKPAESGVYVS